MEKSLFKNEESKKRQVYMADSADSVEERTYCKPLTETELTGRRMEIADNVLEMHAIEHAKKNYIAGLKAQLDLLRRRNVDLTLEVRNGCAEVTGKIFKFIDRQSKMAYFYDEEGEMVVTETRPATRDELSQLRIEFNSKSVNE